MRNMFSEKEARHERDKITTLADLEVCVEDYDSKVKDAVRELELEEVPAMLGEALDAGASAETLLTAMCDGMTEVGGLFESGEYYLADLVLAGEIMKDGLEVLAPLLKADEAKSKGTVVVCTVKGDVHDIGKNLVAMMLTSSGFEVIDLGVDVDAVKVVDAVRSKGAGAVGLSVLLTPMVGSIGEVVRALEAAGLRDRVKIAIGGACTTDALASKMRVDALGLNAVEAVRIFESFFA
jgi:methanogenic corrinoid protein MtbC1